MNFNFEWFDKKVGAPIVTIAKYGLAFNKGAVLKMNRAKYVMLGFDKENQLIGIKACDEPSDYAIEFSARERQGYVRINNKQFIKYVANAIEDDNRFEGKSIQYFGKWEDDSQTMIVDLNKPYNDLSEDSDDDEDSLLK